MDLLKAIEKDVLKQKEEETLNQFSTVAEFREFILASHPTADVSVTLCMCCLQSERLRGGHGTRVTLVDAAQREVFEPTANALADLTPLKRKPYLVQVTVWDAKPTKCVNGKRNIEFEPGAVYKFSHADGVGFYADIAKGSVQYELGNKYKIFEIEPPLKKRKVTCETSPHQLKTKAKEAEDTTSVMSAIPADSDVVMASESKCEENHPTVAKRSKRHG
ncbi:hypothetical protein DVH05_020282 [Phytophthora capsici]|nr:hypothetical protein DVH05_020282 [Phytophthora capsici]